jgi:hypothetical protein
VLFNIPYFFGGIAKMNYDWLIRAQPPTMWFARRAAQGWIFRQWWFPWFVSVGGMGFDLSVRAPLLPPARPTVCS